MRKRKIVDAHHHLWSLGAGYNYPWLQDKRSGEGMLGDLTPIARDYVLDDYRTDAANYDVVGSVHIEALPADPIGETRWLQATANREGLPSAIVARVDLHKPDAEKVLAKLKSFARVRGVRHIVNWHENPKYTFTDLDFLTDRDWLAGFRTLRKYDLSFDLQLYPAQMRDAEALARKNPDILIVVNHAGMPVARDEAGVALWRDGMKRLAALPNVAAKISGLGMVDRGWNEASIRPFVLDVIDRFGVDRAMFASNFPVDKLYSSFDILYGAFETVVASFTESEKDKLFHRNALRIYRISTASE